MLRTMYFYVYIYAFNCFIVTVNNCLYSLKYFNDNIVLYLKIVYKILNTLLFFLLCLIFLSLEYSVI